MTFYLEYAILFESSKTISFTVVDPTSIPIAGTTLIEISRSFSPYPKLKWADQLVPYNDDHPSRIAIRCHDLPTRLRRNAAFMPILVLLRMGLLHGHHVSMMPVSSTSPFQPPRHIRFGGMFLLHFPIVTHARRYLSHHGARLSS